MPNATLIAAGFVPQDTGGGLIAYVNADGIALTNADDFNDIDDGDDVHGADLNSDAQIDRMSFADAIHIFGARCRVCGLTACNCQQ